MRDIKGFENYMITKDGNVFSKHVRRYIKARVISSGYKMVDLYKNNNRSQKLVHRLVAETYLENKNNFPVVNHKDFNKLNNNKDNLEWCTQSEAERSTGVGNSNISECCSGKRKTAGGYKWEIV